MLLTSFSGLKFFTLNDYSIQFVFYFIYINLQISVAILLASFFSNVKTATGLLIATSSCLQYRIIIVDSYFKFSDLITDLYF